MDITLERILSLLPKDKKGNIKRGAKMKVPKARKLPSGSWNIQMCLGGRSVSVTRFSERACILEAERIKAAYRPTGSLTEGNEAKGGKSEQQEPTVADAIQHYIDSRRNVLSPSTLRAYTTMAQNRWKSINQRVASAVCSAEHIAHRTKRAGICLRYVAACPGGALELAGYPAANIGFVIIHVFAPCCVIFLHLLYYTFLT